jgi:hypothetical protein
VKLGTENKTKTIMAAALVLLAAVLVVRAFRGEDNPAPAGKPAASASRPLSAGANTQGRGGNAPTATARKTAAPMLAQTLDPTLRFDLLKASEEVTYKGSGRDIFRSQPEEAAIPKPVAPDVKPGPAPPPPPPPIDLKFYGFASRKDGYKRIFLSKGDDIFVAKEGDIVDRRYKIVHIGQNSVDVEDVLTNNHQTLPLLAG